LRITEFEFTGMISAYNTIIKAIIFKIFDEAP
jgi:hypothetical protein